MKTNIYIAVGVCLLALMIALPVQGEPRYDLHDDLIAHGALEHIGVIDKLPDYVPGQKRQIVIDDSVYQLSDDCIYRNQYGRLVTIRSFIEGINIGYFVLDKTLITKMWYLGESQDDDQSEILQETGGDQGTGDIRQEGGVWKN